MIYTLVLGVPTCSGIFIFIFQNPCLNNGLNYFSHLKQLVFYLKNGIYLLNNFLI